MRMSVFIGFAGAVGIMWLCAGLEGWNAVRYLTGAAVVLSIEWGSTRQPRRA